MQGGCTTQLHKEHVTSLEASQPISDLEKKNEWKNQKPFNLPSTIVWGVTRTDVYYHKLVVALATF